MSKYYDKLVRDNIPAIIEAKGSTAVWERLEGEAYLHRLTAKLDEEVAEYKAGPCLEELADILEVLHALAEAAGSSAEELEALRAVKSAERGGFRERILLKEVIEP